jgi:SAM-dependent methyltransferase
MFNFAFNSVRTHDNFYVKLDPKAPPKESFIRNADIIASHKKKIQRELSIVDFGCATGSFVNYLNSQFPEDYILGIEYLPTLVEKAKLNYPNILVKQGSILDINSLPSKSTDVITLLGVLSIFDDPSPIISNLSHWIKPSGKVLIHGMFNQLEVDVFVRYRLSDDFSKNQFETGWNVISQKTISRMFWLAGAQSIKFHDFSISTVLHKDPNDPIRSWTEKLDDGRLQIVNGTCLKQPQFILEVDY